MACDIFNRYEQKYLIDGERCLELIGFLGQHMAADASNRDGRTYAISNLYCDDGAYSLIRQSLARPPFKEKLRLRAYGVPKPDGPVYLEIKKKYEGKVNKRRTRIPYADALRLLESKGQQWPCFPGRDSLVLMEAKALLQRYPLRPVWYIAYDRLAFMATDRSGLRVSLDHNIRWRTDRLDLAAGDDGQSLLAPDQWLLEVKTPLAIPRWLTGFLGSRRIYPTPFSKVGKAFQACCRDNRQSLLNPANLEIAAADRLNSVKQKEWTLCHLVP